MIYTNKTHFVYIVARNRNKIEDVNKIQRISILVIRQYQNRYDDVDPIMRHWKAR